MRKGGFQANDAGWKHDPRDDCSCSPAGHIENRGRDAGYWISLVLYTCVTFSAINCLHLAEHLISWGVNDDSPVDVSGVEREECYQHHGCYSASIQQTETVKSNKNSIPNIHHRHVKPSHIFGLARYLVATRSVLFSLRSMPIDVAV